MRKIFYIIPTLLALSVDVFGQPGLPPPPAGGASIDTFVAVLIGLSLIYAVRSLKIRKSSSVKGS